MKATLYERFIIVFLCLTLLTGMVILHKKRSRPFYDITIKRQGIKEEFLAEQVENLLKININEADAGKIASIPGLGKVISGRIIEYRRVYGPFNKEQDLLRVKGIGQKKLEKIKEYISIGDREL
ncbi:MAG: helix-hairpin-helix domain-containing protein [Candidatus Omnitrophota bacterium]